MATWGQIERGTREPKMREGKLRSLKGGGRSVGARDGIRPRRADLGQEHKSMRGARGLDQEPGIGRNIGEKGERANCGDMGYGSPREREACTRA